MKWFKKKEKSALEREIDRLTEELSKLDPGTDLYKNISERLTALSDVEAKHMQATKKDKLSPNAIANGLIGLIEVALIMNYERAHVIATKAFSRLMRGRA